MPLVEIPDIGEVEFPDSMASEDIASASKRLYSERRPQPQFQAPQSAPFSPGRENPELGLYTPRVDPEFQIRPIPNTGLAPLTQPLAAIGDMFTIGEQMQKAGAPRRSDKYDVYRDPNATTSSIPALQIIGGAVKGVENVAANTVNFMLSPAGLATLGLSSAPGIVRSVVSAGFAADMASHAPDAYQKFEEARLKGDAPGQAEAITEGLATLAGAGLAGSHSYAQARKFITEGRFGEKLAPLTKEELKIETEPTPQSKPGDVLEAPKAPETPQGVSEPVPTPETTPTAPQQAPAGIPEQPVKAAGAIPQAQAVVSETVRTEGKRSAQEIKDELVSEIQDRLAKAPSEAVPGDKVTIEIPDDGTFVIPNTVEALSEVLKRAKRIKVNEKPPGVPKAAIKSSAKVLSEARTRADEARAKFAEQERAAAEQKAKFEALPKMATPDLEKHFSDWVESRVHPEDRLETEQRMRAFVRQHPDVVERNSWTEIRQMAEREFPEVPSTLAEPSGKPDLGAGAATTPATEPLKVSTPAQPEPAISFPGIGSLREKQATAMELGKIRKNEPELWKAITSYFGETAPGRVTRAAQAAFKRQREQESRAASAGPGAASPVEFEQRARTEAERAAGGEKPPGDNPPVSTDASATPNIEVSRANRDYNILNRVNSGQFAFSFGKLGEAAKAAWQRMALGEFTMRESIGRDVKRYVDDLLGGLPREFRKKGGQAFFEILDGKKLEQIADEWSMRDGGPEVIRAATELKTRLEEIRTTIRDTNRDAYRAYLNSLDRTILEDLFRKNINDQVDISRYPNESLAEALTKDAYRDDWGIADGSYLPHIFFGNWKVTVTDSAGNSRFVTRSKTPHEAEAEIYKFTKRNPELADADFKIEQDTVVPADMIRLGDRRFWKLVSQMKEKTGLSESEVKQAQQGIIGKKSSKQKWWGSLQKREGYEGYSQDFSQVMSAYLNGFHRWVELSKIQREVQPLIEQVRREGRGRAAERLDEIMENLWGKPAKTTIEFDNLIRRIPGLRDYAKPLALERWSRNVRNIVALLTLKTPRFAVINRLQPLQGLYPLVGERIMAQSKFRQHTKEGRELLDRAGVTFDPGQYREGAGGKAMTLSERFSGERTNQEWAFLAMYQHGIERGLPPEAAMKYAKLRGQLFTQFTPLIADTPQIMQGPLTGLLFQFKRFPIKQAELLTRLAQEKRIGGLARWLGVMALAGGASYFLRQIYADAERKKRLRDNIAEQHGEQVADGIMYGLPGLIGADLSGSLVLGDEPFGANIYEKTGRAVTGPAIGIAVDTARQLATEKREPTTVRQDAVTLLKRFPTLRPIAELLVLEDSDLDVRTPDGEVRYRKALKDALLGLGSFRSANESNIKTAIDAMIELKKEIAGLKNQYFVESERGDTVKADAAIEKFNERWPELEISPRELLEYSKLRRRGMDKTDVERISGKKLKPLAP